jgi:hypothetical protein
MKNIFDLVDLTDVPDNLKKELKAHSENLFENQLIKIFELANREINIDEVTVAYFRTYKIMKGRKQIMTKLYNMSKADKSAIKSMPQKGVYKLILEGAI